MGAVKVTVVPGGSGHGSGSLPPSSRHILLKHVKEAVLQKRRRDRARESAAKAHRKVARDRQCIDIVVSDMFSEIAEVDMPAFEELVMDCAHIQLSHDFIEEIFAGADRSMPTTINAEELRHYLLPLNNQQRVSPWAHMYRDWSGIATIAYFMGGAFYILLAMASLERNLATIGTFQAIIGLAGAFSYLVGGVGFGVVAMRTRKIQLVAIRERALMFYGQVCVCCCCMD